MKTRIMIPVVLTGIAALLAGNAYALDLDKGVMDKALREELKTIDSVEVRQAILDEYKDVLRENMPELKIDEATCQSCEEDIKQLEKEMVSKVEIGQENFIKDRESLTSTDTPRVETPTVTVTPDPPPAPEPPAKPHCGCG